MRFVSTTTRDPGFAYPNAPDTMDLGTVLVRSLFGRAVDEQGIVLLHHQLRFLFPKSYNIRPESAVA